MLPDRVSNPGPLTYESGALPIALRGPARRGRFHLIVGRVAQSVGHLTRKSGSWVRYPVRHILSFLLPLIQEGQLSVTGESICTKYWLTA